MPKHPNKEKAEKEQAEELFQAASPEESRALKWQERYRVAVNNQEPMFKRFAQWYDILYAHMDSSQWAAWRSKIYIPKLAAKTWALVAKFVNVTPGWEITVRDEHDPEAREKADKAQSKLEFDYDNPDLEEPIRDKLTTCLVDAIVTGQGLAKVPWRVKEKEVFEHPIGPDGEVDITEEIVTTREVGFNDVIPVNIFNVFMPPAATSLQSSPWVIIREFKSLEDLKAENDVEGGIEIYKNLNKIKGGVLSDRFAKYKKSRNRMTLEEDPVNVDKTIDLVETFECYDRHKGKIYTYANAGTSKVNNTTQWVEIRNQKIGYWHGKYPLVPFYVRKKPFDFWGEGIFETAHRLQNAVNDVINHYMDNWNLSIDGMIMIEESADVDDFIVEPGGKLIYRDDVPKQFKYPEPNPQQLSLVLTELDRALEEVTLSQYITGNPDSRIDQTKGTATGILKIQEAANEKVQFMRQNFQYALSQIGYMWLSNNQQFLDEPVTVYTRERSELKQVVVSPADLQGVMDLRIDPATMDPISNEERLQRHLTYVAHLQELQAASMQQAQLDPQTQPLKFEFTELAQQASDVFGKQDINRVLAIEEPEQPEEESALMPEVAEGAGLPPEMGMEEMGMPDMGPEMGALDMMEEQPELMGGF